MNNQMVIRVCGYVSISCSVLLALATFWAFSHVHLAVGTLAESLRATTESAEIVLDQMVRTTQARVDVADDTLQTLKASRKLVQDLKVAAEKQSALLPQYAASLKSAAAGTYDLAGSVTVVATNLSVQVPVRVERDGLIPVIVWGTPLDASAQALKLFAQRSASLGVSLDAMASSLNGDARALSSSFAESCTRTLQLIDSMEKLAAVVKDEHLPQAISAMRHAKKTLGEVGEQAEHAEQVGYALLAIGLLLATVGGGLSYAILRIANARELEAPKRVARALSL